MARISEEQLVLPALYLLNNSKSGLTTSDLIRDLTVLLQPSGLDAQILANRQDTKFSQKVRNLKSHNSLMKFASYIKKTGSRSGFFTIKTEGKAYLKERFDLVHYLLTNNFASEDIKNSLTLINQQRVKKNNVVIFDENFLIYEGDISYSQSKIYKRSSKLRELAVDKHTIGGHIKCSACCFDFEDFYGSYGKGFIEIHHQKPVFMFNETEYKQTLDEALDNVIPICSNCHRMVHKIKPPLLIEELKSKINQNPTGTTF